MDREKVKFLIQSIEVLIYELKSVVYDESETYKVSETNYSDTEEPISTDELIQNMYNQVIDDTL